MPEAQTKKVAAVAAQTGGIVFHLWPDGANAPNGMVGPPATGRTLAEDEVSSELLNAIDQLLKQRSEQSTLSHKEAGNVNA